MYFKYVFQLLVFQLLHNTGKDTILTCARKLAVKPA